MEKGIQVFILLIFLSINLSATQAQENKKGNFDWPKNRIGITSSTFTGYGLTYYRHFGNDFVGKICMVAYGRSNDNYDNSEEFNSIIGAEFQYNLHKTEFTRLHLFAAFSNWYDESSYTNYLENNNYTSTYIQREYVVGVGFGLEFLAWHTISFNIETGLMERFSVNSRFENTELGTNITKGYPKSYGFGIGGGITYAF